MSLFPSLSIVPQKGRKSKPHACPPCPVLARGDPFPLLESAKTGIVNKLTILAKYNALRLAVAGIPGF
jgi:hypothetical protein